MKKLIKSDRKIECVSDMMSALLDGEVLKNTINNQTIEIINGDLIINGTTSTELVFFVIHNELPNLYESYKRVNWYENIPKQGVICYVGKRRSIACIYNYDKTCEALPFIDAGGIGWSDAVPLTKKELLNLCLEEQVDKDSIKYNLRKIWNLI